MMQRQQLQRSQLDRMPLPNQPLTVRASRHRSLACYARRTVRGSSETSSSKSSPLKRPEPSSSKTRSSKTAPVTVKAPAAPQHNNSTGTQGTQRQPGNKLPNKRSAIEEFMRTTPGFNRLLDGTLILGDAVMVLATELSSERIALEQIPALGGVAVLSWIVAGAILGDYTAEPDPDANPLSDAMGWPIFAAVVNAMITWALGMVVSIFGFSWLVSTLVVEPEMVVEVARDGQLSPQLEISVALLITMSCWRGMAARLRL